MLSLSEKNIRFKNLNLPKENSTLSTFANVLYLLQSLSGLRNFQPRLPAGPSSTFSVHLCAQLLTLPFSFSGFQDSGS